VLRAGTSQALTRGHNPQSLTLPLMEQRYGLRNSETRVKSQGSSESTSECPPSSDHYLPRPSRRSQTYACIAISKGNVTRDTIRWAEIGQQFLLFLLKTAPREGFLRLDAGAFFPPLS